MPRYKLVDRSPRFLPVVLAEQIQPGTFEFALDHLVDHELDLSALDAKFSNDEVGASAYDPRVMLKIVLLAYSRGLVSSRSIEHACLHHVQFIAISGDSQQRRTMMRNGKGAQREQGARSATQVIHKVQSNRAGGSMHQTMKNSSASTVISRCGYRRNRVIAQPR